MSPDVIPDAPSKTGKTFQRFGKFGARLLVISGTLTLFLNNFRRGFRQEIIVPKLFLNLADFGINLLYLLVQPRDFLFNIDEIANR